MIFLNFSEFDKLFSEMLKIYKLDIGNIYNHQSKTKEEKLNLIKDSFSKYIAIIHTYLLNPIIPNFYISSLNLYLYSDLFPLEDIKLGDTLLCSHSFFCSLFMCVEYIYRDESFLPTIISVKPSSFGKMKVRNDYLNLNILETYEYYQKRYHYYTKFENFCKEYGTIKSLNNVLSEFRYYIEPKFNVQLANQYFDINIVKNNIK